MWPMLLDISKDECRGILRRLELEAYASLLSAFRAQGALGQKKRDILDQIRTLLHINLDRHKAEIRRVTNDETLCTVAERIFGGNTILDWSSAGRRTVPLISRGRLESAYTALADSIAKEAYVKNKEIKPLSQEDVPIRKELADHPNVALHDYEQQQQQQTRPQRGRKRHRASCEDHHPSQQHQQHSQQQQQIPTMPPQQQQLQQTPLPTPVQQSQASQTAAPPQPSTSKSSSMTIGQQQQQYHHHQQQQQLHHSSSARKLQQHSAASSSSAQLHTNAKIKQLYNSQSNNKPNSKGRHHNHVASSMKHHHQHHHHAQSKTKSSRAPPSGAPTPNPSFALPSPVVTSRAPPAKLARKLFDSAGDTGRHHHQQHQHHASNSNMTPQQQHVDEMECDTSDGTSLPETASATTTTKQISTQSQPIVLNAYMDDLKSAFVPQQQKLMTQQQVVAQMDTTQQQLQSATVGHQQQHTVFLQQMQPNQQLHHHHQARVVVNSATAASGGNQVNLKVDPASGQVLMMTSANANNSSKSQQFVVTSAQNVTSSSSQHHHKVGGGKAVRAVTNLMSQANVENPHSANATTTLIMDDVKIKTSNNTTPLSKSVQLSQHNTTISSASDNNLKTSFNATTVQHNLKTVTVQNLIPANVVVSSHQQIVKTANVRQQTINNAITQQQQNGRSVKLVSITPNKTNASANTSLSGSNRSVTTLIPASKISVSQATFAQLKPVTVQSVSGNKLQNVAGSVNHGFVGAKTNFILLQKQTASAATLQGKNKDNNAITLTKDGREISAKIVMPVSGDAVRIQQQQQQDGSTAKRKDIVEVVNNSATVPGVKSGNVIVLGLGSAAHGTKHSVLAQILQASGMIPAGTKSEIIIKNNNSNSSSSNNNNNQSTSESNVFVDNTITTMPDGVSEMSSNNSRVITVMPAVVGNKQKILNRNANYTIARRDSRNAAVVTENNANAAINSTDWEEELDNAVSVSNTNRYVKVNNSSAGGQQEGLIRLTMQPQDNNNAASSTNETHHHTSSTNITMTTTKPPLRTTTATTLNPHQVKRKITTTTTSVSNNNLQQRIPTTTATSITVHRPNRQAPQQQQFTKTQQLQQLQQLQKQRQQQQHLQPQQTQDTTEMSDSELMRILNGSPELINNPLSREHVSEEDSETIEEEQLLQQDNTTTVSRDDGNDIFRRALASADINLESAEYLDEDEEEIVQVEGTCSNTTIDDGTNTVNTTQTTTTATGNTSTSTTGRPVNNYNDEDVIYEHLMLVDGIIEDETEQLLDEATADGSSNNYLYATTQRVESCTTTNQQQRRHMGTSRKAAGQEEVLVDGDGNGYHHYHHQHQGGVVVNEEGFEDLAVLNGRGGAVATAAAVIEEETVVGQDGGGVVKMAAVEMVYEAEEVTVADSGNGAPDVQTTQQQTTYGVIGPVEVEMSLMPSMEVT